MVSKDSKHTNTSVPSGTSDKIGTGGDSGGTVCVVGRNSLRSSEQILVVILFFFFSLKEKVSARLVQHFKPKKHFFKKAQTSFAFGKLKTQLL